VPSNNTIPEVDWLRRLYESQYICDVIGAPGFINSTTKTPFLFPKPVAISFLPRKVGISSLLTKRWPSAART
jgi:hypothetical protein